MNMSHSSNKFDDSAIKRPEWGVEIIRTGQFPWRGTLATTRHGAFKKCRFALLGSQVTIIAVEEGYTDNCSTNEVSWMTRKNKETVGSEIFACEEQVSLEPKEKMDIDMEDSSPEQEASKVNENDGILLENANRWNWFIVNTGTHEHGSYSLLVKSAIRQTHSPKLKDTVNKSIVKSKDMHCWTMSNRPPKNKVLFPKLLLRWKRNEQGVVLKCTAGLVICGNEDDHFHDKDQAPIADFTEAKFMMSSCSQQRWEPSYVTVEKTVCKGHLERLEYVALWRRMYRQEEPS